MSATFERVRKLVAAGDVRISEHGYDELAGDDILVMEVLASLDDAVVVEDYPTASRGASVLVLQRDEESKPVHVVWGIPLGQTRPAVLITAYRPDPARWSADLTERLK